MRAKQCSARVEALLGYSMHQLKAHIERQFTKGMGWDAWSRSGIHIDHILPKKWAADNLKKGSKIQVIA